MCDARRWEVGVENVLFELEGEMLTPSEMLFIIKERVRWCVPPVRLRWRRLCRHAHLVGAAARRLRQIYEEVSYRPQHTGAKRSREHFQSLCA
jgi:hypothetical protein